jgi:putative transcriptional regulator
LTTRSAVVLHGLAEGDVWEHAPDLARVEGFSLAVSELPLEDLLVGLRRLP